MRKAQTSVTRRRKNRPRVVRSASNGRLVAVFQTIHSMSGKDRLEFVSPNQRIELPDPLTDVMTRAAGLLAEGHNVVVMANDEMLTTQSAAKLLNVSRQHVVRLIDKGDLPATMVGSHRRIRAIDVENYRHARDADRHAALRQLVELSEELGGYGLGG